MVTLVTGMVGYYENKHSHQIVGLEGKDLAVEHQQELLEHTVEISSDSIQKLYHMQFHIASKSWPGLYHTVDLHQSTCQCEGFPRIQFCRHIAAILCHFSKLSLRKLILYCPLDCPLREQNLRTIPNMFTFAGPSKPSRYSLKISVC